MELLDYQKERIELIQRVLKMTGNEFVLKGGTALILYYGLDRFSEDVDLDAKGSNMNIIDKLKNPGYKVWNLSIKKDTPTVFRVMIDYGAKNDRGAYPLKVEISSRNKEFLQKGLLEYKTIDNINVYTEKELVNMKVNTFAQRTKARDLYDLGYLIKKYPGEFSREQLLSVMDNINYKGMDSLEYSLRLEMKEHHLAKIDPATYIIELYERCSCRLEELQEEQEWNIGFSFDKGFKL